MNWVLFLILLTIWVQSSYALPPGCIEPFQGSVDCHNKKIKTFPQITLSSTKYNEYGNVAIHLERNEIEALPKNLFGEQLIEIDATKKNKPLCVFILVLEDNKINKIDKDAFSNEPGCLEMLFLNYNKLTGIEMSAIKNLTSLTLAHNQLTTIKDTTFANVPKLTRLYLEFNKINTIEANAFKQLKDLESLTLEGNLLTSFKPNLFTELGKLMHFDISFMYMEPPNKETFKGIAADCQVLRNVELNITAQQLTKGSPKIVVKQGMHTRTDMTTVTVPRCSGYIYVHEPLGDWNATDYTPLWDAKSCVKPKIDDHDHARIGLLECEGLTEIPKLVVNMTYISNGKCQIYNGFHDIAFFVNNIPIVHNNLFTERLFQYKENKMAPLCTSHLTMSHNGLKQIMDDAFKGEPGCLDYVDFSFNELTEIPKALQALQNLKFLILANNPISVVKANSFKSLALLNTLKLDACHIVTVEKNAFDGLTNLKVLYIGQNNGSATFKTDTFGLPASAETVNYT